MKRQTTMPKSSLSFVVGFYNGKEMEASSSKSLEDRWFSYDEWIPWIEKLLDWTCSHLFCWQGVWGLGLGFRVCMLCSLFLWFFSLWSYECMFPKSWMMNASTRIGQWLMMMTSRPSKAFMISKTSKCWAVQTFTFDRDKVACVLSPPKPSKPKTKGRRDGWNDMMICESIFAITKEPTCGDET